MSVIGLGNHFIPFTLREKKRKQYCTDPVAMGLHENLTGCIELVRRHTICMGC